MTTPLTVLDYARLYVAAGVSILPIQLNGSKRPAVAAWTEYQRRLPTDDELRLWFERERPFGIATVGGQVSGHLEQIDFDLDAQTTFPQWRALVEAEEPELFGSLSIVVTPRQPSGYHVRYRCPDVVIPGNDKLAMLPADKAVVEDGKKQRVLIETRGEGGYALSVGSPAACHERRQEYRILEGHRPPWVLPEITAQERDVLLRCARFFDQDMPTETSAAANATSTSAGNGRPSAHASGSSLRPGDDFCERGPAWSEILTGWEMTHTTGEIGYWRRPGKTGKSWSATTGKCHNSQGYDLFAVFSTNAEPFPGPGNGHNCSVHTKFQAYTLLHHGGNFAAATKALAAIGYGKKADPKPINGKAHANGAAVNGSANGAPVNGHANGAQVNGNGHAHDADLPGERFSVPERERGFVWTNPIPLSRVPSVPDFPLHVFPEALQDYAREIAQSMHCPIDYAAVPMLVMAGGAIGNSTHGSIKRTHSQAPLLYAAVCGPKGSAKSPAMEISCRPFEDLDHVWDTEYQERMKEWETAEPELRGSKPIQRRCFVGDVTVESLKPILKENPRGLLMVRDELMAVVAGMNQYKSNGGNDRQFFLSLWNSATQSVDRKSDTQRGGRPLKIYRPFMGIVGGIQPDILPGLLGQIRRGVVPPDDGWADRWLISFPEPMEAAGENWLEVSAEAMEAWKHAVGELLALNMVAEDDGRQRPFFAHLDDSGRVVWQAFTDRHAADMRKEDFPAYLTGHWSKLKGYCARFAVILACLHMTQPGASRTLTLTGPILEAAVDLVDYFKAHTKKVYAITGADPCIADAKRAWQWIKAEKLHHFSNRDMHQKFKATLRSAESIQPILKVLQDHEIVKSAGEPERTGGRPRGPIWAVNPKAFEAEFEDGYAFSLPYTASKASKAHKGGDE